MDLLQVVGRALAHALGVERRHNAWAGAHPANPEFGLIRDNRDIGVSDLARAMNIHQSTASNLVKALVERDLVATSKDTGDRRAVKLNWLPAGAKVIKRRPGPLAGVLPEALESLDPKTPKRLEADPAALLAALKTDEKAGKVPLAHL